MASAKFWIWLSAVGDPVAAWKIYEHFGDVEKAYFADPEEYKLIPGLRAHQIAPFLNKEQGSKLVSKIVADCRALGVHICTWESADYPERLRYIDVPPLVLYLLGRPLRIEEECVVAMAGTRRCSPYGQAMSWRFAEQLTREGALVLTGVAGGCDEAAVVGALQAGGPVAVLLPGGVDVPFENTDFYRALYQNIASFGTLISTYPPGTPNDHAHFRFRNAVLTGLSTVVLLVEAGLRSGALNVAANANDQGRTVYTIPANLDSWSAMGTNGLLCNGQALAVMSAEDMLLTYRDSFPRLSLPKSAYPYVQEEEKAPAVPPTAAAKEDEPDTLPPETETSQAAIPEKKVDTADISDYIDLKAVQNDFTDDEQSILRALQDGSRTSEELTAQTEIPSARMLAALTLLTLRGSVRECGSGRFEAAVKGKG